MKILNESGINKILDYLDRDYLSYSCINGKHVLVGNLEDNDIGLLEDINVKLNAIDGLSEDRNDGVHLYEAELDDVEVNGDNNDNSVDQNVGDKLPEGDAQNMAKKLMPYLSKIFPTKEEINNVLNDLLAQMIDPDEMIDGLKKQIQRIKRQSRETDEIG